MAAIRESVVDVRFNARLPAIRTMLRTGTGQQIAIEVLAQQDAQHLCGIAMTPTQGLARGMQVVETGEPHVTCVTTRSMR